MFVCKNCKSKRIKTRTNSSYGKSSMKLAVRCKDCSSTDIDKVEENRRRRFK